MKNSSRWTIVRSAFSSPDGCSWTQYVAVSVSAAVLLALRKCYGELQGLSSDKIATADEPERGWWPEHPPEVVKAALAKLAASLWPEDADAPASLRSLLLSLAKGEWVYHKSVPDELKQPFRELATAEAEGEWKLNHSFSSDEQADWNSFFSFLRRIGVEVQQLPTKAQHENAQAPQFDEQQARLMQRVLESGADAVYVSGDVYPVK